MCKKKAEIRCADNFRNCPRISVLTPDSRGKSKWTWLKSCNWKTFCIHTDLLFNSIAYSRGTFDRQDSVRSDYMSDRDGRYGIVQQASLESTDSRLCYLTSSEVSYPSTRWPYRSDTSKCLLDIGFVAYSHYAREGMLACLALDSACLDRMRS
jgi:hypothetical protein